MPLKFFVGTALLLLGIGCSAVKYNIHVAPDGSNGFLRTYYSSEKEKFNSRSDGTGIEHCKVQGTETICKDLNISLPVEKTAEGKKVGSPEAKSVKAESTPAPAKPKKK